MRIHHAISQLRHVSHICDHDRFIHGQAKLTITLSKTRDGGMENSTALLLSPDYRADRAGDNFDIRAETPVSDAGGW